MITITQCLLSQHHLLLGGGGVVITSGESASVIMAQLSALFPKCSFYGKGKPDNIIIDDSLAEREGLQRTWTNSTIYLMHISLFTKYVEMVAQ